MGRRLLHGATSARMMPVGAVLILIFAMIAGALVAPAKGEHPSSLAPSVKTHGTSETVSLSGLQTQFESLAVRLSPAVVAISGSINAVNREELIRAETVTPDRLSTVFARSARTVGTGLVIDPDGYILTNDHVITDVQALWVTTDDGKVYPAFVVGSDPRSDLAVLKIPASGLKPVRFATKPAQRGQWTLAIGNPYGLSSEGEMCLSVGVVSAVGRSLPKLADAEKRLYSNLIQTTAEINPGNSGGPLFNLSGEVIGINTAVVLPQKSTNGIGFAIPINDEVLPVVQSLKEGREIVHGYLGVLVSRPSVADARNAGMNPDTGALVDAIEVDSPAAASALRVGDLVAAVDGQAVRDGDHMVRMISRSPVDRPVKLAIRRGGRPMSVDVQLRRRVLSTVAVNRENQRLRWRGLLLGPVPGNWNASLHSSTGGVMVLAVDRMSQNVPSGITQGSIITSIGGLPIAGIKELQMILNDLPAEQCSVQVLDGTGGSIMAASKVSSIAE